MKFLIHQPQTNLRKMQGPAAAEVPSRVQTGVGIIPIVGVLSPRSDGWFEMGSTYEQISAALERFNAEPAITKIVLDVDSCGGSADGVFELAEKIRESQKPVIAYGRGLVASAAYLLFAAAHVRIAHRSTFIGSVGAYECHYIGDTGEIKYIVSSQSPKKVPDPSTPDGEAVIQARVDALAEMFIGDLATYFNSTPEKVLADFGGGEIMLATAAQRAGMVDIVGNFKTALAAEKTIANMVDKTSGASYAPNTRSAAALLGARGKRMARKMALVITDDANVTEGAESFEVTKDSIKEKFPEVYEAIQKDAMDAAAKAAEEVEAVAESADESNPAEKEMVAQARAGKMSATELAVKLVAEKKRYMSSDAFKLAQIGARRQADQPAVITASAGDTNQKKNPFLKVLGKGGK